MNNGSRSNVRKTAAVLFFTFVVLGLAGLATFERSRQSNRRKNLTQG